MCVCVGGVCAPVRVSTGIGPGLRLWWWWWCLGAVLCYSCVCVDIMFGSLRLGVRWGMARATAVAGREPWLVPRVPGWTAVVASPFSSTAGEGEEKLEGDEGDLKVDILQSALGFVPVHGWTVEALAAGAEECGLPPISHGIVQRGAVELVEHFSKSATEAAIAEAVEYFDSTRPQDDTEQPLAPVDKIKYVMRKRLERVTPFVESWPQAMALGAMPANLPDTVSSLARTVTSLWNACELEEISAAHQTLLGGVYVSTEIYMLADTSEGHRDTWEFLERQIDAAINLSEAASSRMAQAGQGVGGMGSDEAPLRGAQAVASVVGTNVGSLVSTFVTMASQAIMETAGTPPTAAADPKGKKSV